VTEAAGAGGAGAGGAGAGGAGAGGASDRTGPVELLRMAARVARAEPLRVYVPAVAVFGLEAVANTSFTELAADHLGGESLISFVLLMFSTLGLTFYGGLLERLVGACERGLPAPPVWQVLRTLPYGRLIAADLVFWLLDGAASILFIVPAIAVTTLGALVGPLITMRDLSVRAAFAASVRLVRPRFLLVLCMITIPLAAEHEIVTAVALYVHHENVLLVLGSHILMGLIFGVSLGLVEMSLAERLVNGARGPAQPVRSVVSAKRTQGGRDGRDDSRDGHAGTGALPPAG
jgi:hypothetical protein